MPPCSDLTEGSISKCQWCVGTTLHRQCVLCSVCEGRGDWRPLCLLFNKHGTGTLRCLQKEMATYRHWPVSLWQDPDDVPHCWILSPDKTEWQLISATLADEDAVWWLTSYGSWHAYEKKKCQLWRLLSYRKKIFFPVLQKWYVMLHGTVVERWSLTGELSLPCARPAADGWPLMWVNRPLWTS